MNNFYYHFFLLLSIKILFRKFFFFNDTATTKIYTLSLHDALPIFEFQCIHIHLKVNDSPRFYPFEFKKSQNHIPPRLRSHQEFSKPRLHKMAKTPNQTTTFPKKTIQH